ncbi:MAG: ABC transporter ATP-binding protein [Bacillota bacterium]
MHGGFRGRMMSAEETDYNLTQLDRRTIGFFLGYVRPHLWTLLGAFGAMLVVTLTTLAGPYLSKIAIDDYILQGDLAGLNLVFAVMLLTYGLFWLSSYWQTYLSSWMGQRIVGSIRTDLYGHLQRLSMDFFNHRQTGDVMSRVTHDVNTLSELVTTGLLRLVNDLLTLVGIVVILVTLNLRLALITFVTIPIIYLAISHLGRRMRLAYRDVQQRLADLNADVEQNLSGIRVVQALNREAINTGEFDRLSWANLKANLRAVSVFALLFPTMTFSRVLGEALVLWYGGWGVFHGVLTLGVLVAFLGYVRQFFAPLADLSQVYNTLQVAGAGLDRIWEYMSIEPAVREPEDPVRPEEGFRGGLSFREVSFAYGDEPVIRHLNLEVEAGEVFALVGSTGAGKTTVANLLARLYDVDEGSVAIDGVDLRQIALKDLRDLVAVVPQNVFLFDQSIRENIRYGSPGATDEEVEDAARRVGAHDIISSLPEGYDTQVGEGGMRLSGGQRQLVSFVRALLADPAILILDEATSSVDAYTEMILQEAMEELLSGRTAIIIAHRFTTLRKADRIGVMDGGVLVATGTHEELMDSCDIYRELFEKQKIDVA